MTASRRPIAGLSLVELLVALAIGSVLIVGAVTVYSNSRSTYAVNESIARLQERGRYVMSVVEPDIELAGYYGFTNLPDTLRLVNGAAPSAVLATARAVAPTTDSCRQLRWPRPACRDPRRAAARISPSTC